MTVPNPTPIYRMIHISNLDTLLRRGGLHAPNCVPNDGLAYHCIHNTEIQFVRHYRIMDKGPRGTLHDYIPFYFGPRQPMLLQLKTGQVEGYNEGQEPIVYLVSSVQKIKELGIPFIFSDGHGLAAITDWYDDLGELVNVDWGMVYQHYWADIPEDNDRQRRKQAEFLVYRFCPWSAIERVVAVNQKVNSQVVDIISKHPDEMQREVLTKPSWYY